MSSIKKETSAASPADAQQQGKVTAATYGALDTSQVETQLWMAKIPPQLAEAWKNAPEGTELGELILTKGAAAGPPKLTIQVNEAVDTAATNLPLDYTVENMTKKVPTLHPYSRLANGSVLLHGTVARTCNLQMERTERYKQMCRNRILSHTVRSDRYVKTVDKSELSMVRSSRRQIVGGRGPVGSDTNNTTSSGFGGSVQQFGKRLLDAQNNLDDTFSNSRKRKFEGQPVRSVIFELFEHQPIWSVKELRAESGRLEKEIRQVLGEICEFHRSGEHKGFWELRKEFRKADVNEDTPSSTTAQKPSDAHEKKSSSS